MLLTKLQRCRSVVGRLRPFLSYVEANYLVPARDLLPRPFVNQMKDILGSDFPDFANALEQAPTRGFRLHAVSTQYSSGEMSLVNQDATLLATSAPVPPQMNPLCQTPVPWCEDAFYLPASSSLGQTAYQCTGAFYIQEPSAMAVAVAVEAKPGERILDLCAAPGGKTTAIAKSMRGEGVLVANEIHPKRVLALAENIERLGINALIANETPNRLAAAWPAAFDAILVDAPCSGEGMFRKDVHAVTEWTAQSPSSCAARQRDILSHAYRMLRPGGRLIYATCTFNLEENEHIVAWCVDELGLVIDPLPHLPGWSPGISDAAAHHPDLALTRRFWPHLGAGEGHFIARLRKSEQKIEDSDGTETSRGKTASKTDVQGQISTQAFDAWWAEAMRVAKPNAWENAAWVGDTLIVNVVARLPTRGLRVLRRGLMLFQRDGKRERPHHSLAMAIAAAATRRPLALPEPEARRFLRGEALDGDADCGLRLVTLDGLGLGFANVLTNRANNLLPKGLRRSDLQPL